MIPGLPPLLVRLKGSASAVMAQAPQPVLRAAMRPGQPEPFPQCVGEGDPRFDVDSVTSFVDAQDDHYVSVFPCGALARPRAAPGRLG
jgi:hypothetical protein